MTYGDSDKRERTAILGLVLNKIGRPFPSHIDANSWGDVLNGELRYLDKVIGTVCRPDQIEEIRNMLRRDEPGLILGNR